MRVVDHVVEQLWSRGVRHLFGVGGANIEDLYDAAHAHAGIAAVLAKHEFSAATMADGYSRAGVGVGVVVATSGGASLNLLPGLGESLASRVPVLALIGQPPSTLDGHGSFQDMSGANGALDAEAVFAPVSLYCRRLLDPDDIVAALPEALAAAERGGPAVLLLPKDIQQGEIAGTPATASVTATSAPAPSEIAALADALRAADGPITIIAGEQVARDDARDELEQLRGRLGARVATVPDAKDASDAALGVTGVMGHPGVVDAVAASALCLIVGTRLSLTARAGLEAVLAPERTRSIGSAPPYLQCTHVDTADLRAALSDLTQHLGAAPAPDRRNGHPGPGELRPPAYAGDGLRYRDAMAVLHRLLPDDTDIVVDAGNTGAAAIHYLPARPGGRFVVALGMGGMGYAFGAGVGMCFGRGHRTVVIAGDGSFFMHGMEIHTAREYGLPVTFVLLNNNAHAMCVNREQLFYGDRYSYNRFQPSRLALGLAAMFPGLPCSEVSDSARLHDALATALGTEGPSVISIDCAADELPPFAPFLTQVRRDTQCPTSVH